MSAALAYAQAGLYVLPVKRGSKHPGSVVRDNWPSKSTRDPKVIAALWTGTNHGIALHLGPSGLMALDIDDMGKVPAWLRTTLADAGAPYQSSRPDTEGRGHYIFRQPAARRIGNSEGKLKDMGLDVRGVNGVIILEPTYHPEGGEYRWRATGAIPELPEALADKLPDADDRESAASDAEVTAFIAEHTEASRPEAFNTWPQKFADALAPPRVAACENGFHPARRGRGS